MQPLQLPWYLYSEDSEYSQRSKYSPSSMTGVMHICAARNGETPSRRESASFEAAPSIGRPASLTWRKGEWPLVHMAAASRDWGCSLSR